MQVALVKKTRDKQERLANAQAVIDAMRQLGLDYTPTPKDLISAPARDLVLFCTYLFNAMPGFIPKATVDFEGRLNDKVVKYIELSNPSNKPLTYSVRVEGTPPTLSPTLTVQYHSPRSTPFRCVVQRVS